MILLLFALLPLAVLWASYVCMLLWTWFLVPAGLPPLSLGVFVGVRLLFLMFCKIPKDEPDPAEAIFMGFVAPALMLALAALLRAVL